MLAAQGKGQDGGVLTGLDRDEPIGDGSRMEGNEHGSSGFGAFTMEPVRV